MKLQTRFFLAVTALSSGPHLLLLRSFSFSSWKTGGPSCSSASELISIFCTMSFSRLCCFSIVSDISFSLRNCTAHGLTWRAIGFNLGLELKDLVQLNIVFLLGRLVLPIFLFGQLPFQWRKLVAGRTETGPGLPHLVPTEKPSFLCTSTLNQPY